MKTLNQIKVFSFAKFQAFLMALVGLLAGTLYAVVGLIIDTLVSFKWIVLEETSGLSSGTVLAFMALIGMPIIFAVCGFLVGIVEAVLYNLFVKRIGRLKIDFGTKLVKYQSFFKIL